MTDVQFLIMGVLLGTFAGMGWGYAAAVMRGDKGNDGDK